MFDGFAVISSDVGGFSDVFAHRIGDHALLFDRRGNLQIRVFEFTDGAMNGIELTGCDLRLGVDVCDFIVARIDGLASRFCARLQFTNHGLDLARRILSTFGKCSYLISHDSKTTSLLTSTSCFNRRVQGE